MMKLYNQTVEEIFHPQHIYTGEIGVEIEVEGQGLPQAIPSYWAVHRDNSLRGESAEYVLSRPCSRDSVFNFLKYLKRFLDKSGSQLNLSNRCSVHVHLNQQGLMIRQIYSNICLYLLLEDLLVEYAGETRVGNLFCLRASDAEYFVNQLIRAAQREDFSVFAEQERLRYASCNVCSLSKFNTLEFRALRGTVDPDVIYEWVQILLKIKDAALKYPDPRQICQDFSAMGPRRFLEHVLGKQLAGRFNTKANLEMIMWDGLRNVQDIAYAVDWEVILTPPKKRVFGHRATVVQEHADEDLLPVRMEVGVVNGNDRVVINAAPQWGDVVWGEVGGGFAERLELLRAQQRETAIAPRRRAR